MSSGDILRETQISQFCRYAKISQLLKVGQFCRYVGDINGFIKETNSQAPLGMLCTFSDHRFNLSYRTVK
jgi:hypothetical protein